MAKCSATCNRNENCYAFQHTYTNLSMNCKLYAKNGQSRPKLLHYTLCQRVRWWNTSAMFLHTYFDIFLPHIDLCWLSNDSSLKSNHHFQIYNVKARKSHKQRCEREIEKRERKRLKKDCIFFTFVCPI